MMIRATTGSRLHFGLLSFGQSAERQFGGFGVMVEQPSIELTLQPSDDWEASGPGSERALKIAQSWVEQNGRPEAAFRVNMIQLPPEHVGFGVGTQLTLAIAAALEKWFCAPWSLSRVHEIAPRLGRGLRSAVGIHGFAQGGLLVEGGKWAVREVAPLLVRMPFPSQWRWLLIRPRDEQGHFGTAERRAFDQLPPVSLEKSGLMCREILTHLLPAVQETRFEEFSASLRRYGELAGSCFIEVQQGRIVHPKVCDLVELLKDWQVDGYAQSSWGPTVCVACPNQVAAQRLQDRIEAAQPDVWRILITAARNTGASIEQLPE